MKMITSQYSSLLFGKPFLNLQVSALRANPVFAGVNAPPAEREASGGPLEGGDHVGKAPKGLL